MGVEPSASERYNLFAVLHLKTMGIKSELSCERMKDGLRGCGQ